MTASIAPRSLWLSPSPAPTGPAMKPAACASRPSARHPLRPARRPPSARRSCARRRAAGSTPGWPRSASTPRERAQRRLRERGGTQGLVPCPGATSNAGGGIDPARRGGSPWSARAVQRPPARLAPRATGRQVRNMPIVLRALAGKIAMPARPCRSRATFAARSRRRPDRIDRLVPDGLGPDAGRAQQAGHPPHSRPAPAPAPGDPGTAAASPGRRPGSTRILAPSCQVGGAGHHGQRRRAGPGVVREASRSARRRPSRSAAWPACGFLEHAVEIAAAEAEGADARAPADAGRSGQPRPLLGVDVERRLARGQRPRAAVDLDRRRQHLVMQRQRRLDQPGGARGRLGVADLRLDRAEGAPRAGPRLASA